MRISTAMFYRQGTNAISELQSSLVRTQMELASGNRLLSAADDPVGAARLIDINTTLERTEQYQRNANMARNRLGTEEQALTDVEKVLFRVRDLAIQANNDTLDTQTRGYIAAETTEALEQLVQIANTRDAEGNFLFAGFSSQAQPFTQNSGIINYNGDQGERQIQISDTRHVADGDSGAAIFMQIKNGTGTFVASAGDNNSGTGQLGTRSLIDSALWNNASFGIRFTAPDAYDVVDAGGSVISSGTYTDGDAIEVQGISVVLTGAPDVGDDFQLGPSQQQDMFSTINNFIDALGNSPDPAGLARLHNEVGNALEDLDRSIDNVLDFRTRVGTRLQAIDSQEITNADFSITLETARAELQQVDYAEAVTRLSQQLTGLESAQRSFARIQGLSLFNLL